MFISLHSSNYLCQITICGAINTILNDHSRSEITGYLASGRDTLFALLLCIRYDPKQIANILPKISPGTSFLSSCLDFVMTPISRIYNRVLVENLIDHATGCDPYSLTFARLKEMYQSDLCIHYGNKYWTPIHTPDARVIDIIVESLVDPIDFHIAHSWDIETKHEDILYINALTEGTHNHAGVIVSDNMINIYIGDLTNPEILYSHGGIVCFDLLEIARNNLIENIPDITEFGSPPVRIYKENNESSVEENDNESSVDEDQGFVIL